MGTPLGPKYLPKSYMDPLGKFVMQRCDRNRPTEVLLRFRLGASENQMQLFLFLGGGGGMGVPIIGNIISGSISGLSI